VVPGEYSGRTEHIHVKVAAQGRPVLTTQLFFPGVARNSSDSIFDPALLVRLSDGATGKAGAFDFELPA
jgi:protocatechuate 3,4-dioxygenase beta subunit